MASVAAASLTLEDALPYLAVTRCHASVSDFGAEAIGALAEQRADRMKALGIDSALEGRRDGGRAARRTRERKGGDPPSAKVGRLTP